jgi:hypothetical protein
MFSRRLTRAEAGRTLTCLEVSELGLLAGFKVCSGCDYYRNNIALNAMAQKKPRSMLSSYWQCTTPHSYGEVVESSSMSTPYQPVKLTKYNSLQVVSRGTGDVEHSSYKRVRLFSPQGVSTDDVSDGTQQVTTVAPVRGFDRNAVLRGHNVAVVERDVARAELKKIARERDRVSEQLNVTVKELAGIKSELANAVLKRNQYLSERDIARQEHAAALGNLTIITEQRDQMEEHHRTARQNMLREMQEKQAQLAQRVAYLEAMNNGASVMRVSQKANKDKLRLIEKFAALLSPELVTKEEQLNELFEVLFHRRKKFKKYVKAKLTDDIRDGVRLATCREIKKLFAPWRVLQVMDCSQQSLNQVSVAVMYHYEIIFHFLICSFF